MIEGIPLPSYGDSHYDYTRALAVKVNEIIAKLNTAEHDASIFMLAAALADTPPPPPPPIDATGRAANG